MYTMRVFLFVFAFLLVLVSCNQKTVHEECGLCGVNMNRVDTPENPEAAMLQVKQADTSTAGNAEFKENKLNIEKIYGEQWDFCKCVVANDSLDKAVKAGDITDKLMERFDEVDIKCKSFLVMDNTRTPEERAKHDKKIRNCLRAAGLR